LRLKLFKKSKWYAVYHWVEEYPWNDKRWNTPFITRYLYWLNRWFSWFLIKLFADNILAVSDPTKEKLIRIKWINKNRIKSVNCWIDFDKIQSIAKKYSKEEWKKFDAVFMKRLNYWKWVYDLLEIWKNVCKTKPDAKLWIIGEGSEDVLKKVNSFIKTHRLEKNIHLFWVIYDFEEKYRILNTSKIFILPSHEENWAIVIWEAMAISLPVIAYDLTEIKPIWKDNIEWVEFWKINNFSKKVLSLLSDSDKRKKMNGKALKFIKDYDWETIATNELI
jgi:glycosyltransferase involved in cell wall biosynthesis